MTKIYIDGEINESAVRTAAKLFADAGQLGLTRKALQDHLQCDHRMADRAKRCLAHKLNGAEFDRVRLESNPKVLRFVMTKPPRWHHQVTPSTLLALDLGSAFLDGAGGALLASDLKHVHEKLTPDTSEVDRTLYKKMSSRLMVVKSFDSDPTPLQSEVFSTLMKALASNPVLEVRVDWIAPDGDGSVKRLTLAPYTMSMDIRAGVVCLLAWDTRAKAVVSVRLPDVQRVVLTGKVTGTLELAKAGLERAATYQLDGAAGEEEPFQVRLRVRERMTISSLVSAQPNFQNFRMSTENTGAGLVEFKTNRLREIGRWVLSLGGGVEVMAPEVLKAEVVLQARLFLANNACP